MAAITISQLEQTVNVRARRNDDLAQVIDTNLDLTGYTVTSDVVSVVDGSQVATCAISVTSATAGTLQITMPTTMPAGTYNWQLSWDAPGGTTRKALSGTYEVT